MIPIIGEKTEVYIVLIDSKGILAFQSFTLDRWAKCQKIYNSAKNPKNSHLFFKIKLAETESQLCKAIIKNHTFMAAAGYICKLRASRGDAE